MSYFIYVPAENLNQPFTPQQMQAYYTHFQTDSFFKPYQTYPHTTLIPSMNSLTEYFNFCPQQEIYIPNATERPL